MASGKEKHADYLRQLSLLGKDLARRAKSRCELSGAPGALVNHDLLPDDKNPSLDTVVLVTEEVSSWLHGNPFEPSSARFLETTVWSTEPAVRLACNYLLGQIDENWARDAAENLELMFPQSLPS